MAKKKLRWGFNDGTSFEAYIQLDEKKERVIIGTWDCGQSEILKNLSYLEFLAESSQLFSFRYFSKETLNEINKTITENSHKY